MPADDDLIVLRYGVSPSADSAVLAFGDRAFDIAEEAEIIEKAPHWDGSTADGIPIGGHYAVLDDTVSRETLERIAAAHTVPEQFPDEDLVPAVDDDGQVVDIERTSVDDALNT